MLEEWLKPVGAFFAALLGSLGVLGIIRQRDKERLAELEEEQASFVKHPELAACMSRIERQLAAITRTAETNAADTRAQHSAIYELIRVRDDRHATHEKEIAGKVGELAGAVRSLEQRVR